MPTADAAASGRTFFFNHLVPASSQALVDEMAAADALRELCDRDLFAHRTEPERLDTRMERTVARVSALGSLVTVKASRQQQLAFPDHAIHSESAYPKVKGCGRSSSLAFPWSGGAVHSLCVAPCRGGGALLRPASAEVVVGGTCQDRDPPLDPGGLAISRSLCRAPPRGT